jgi:hypothetical protein
MPQGRELEVRARRGGHDPGAVEEMGVALRRGHHRGRFAVGFAEEAVGGTGDQSPGGGAVLHQLQKGAELLRRQGQIFPHRGEGFAVLIFMRHGEHDQPGQQRLGFFVPVRL